MNSITALRKRAAGWFALWIETGDIEFLRTCCLCERLAKDLEQKAAQ